VRYGDALSLLSSHRNSNGRHARYGDARCCQFQ